jgi:hypothetical protein
LRSVKQKLQVADNKLLELNDKLERRDRLIENLNRAQNERVFSVDRFKNEVTTLRKREQDLQIVETTLRNENLVLQECIRTANSRIEQAVRVGTQLASFQYPLLRKINRSGPNYSNPNQQLGPRSRLHPSGFREQKRQELRNLLTDKLQTIPDKIMAYAQTRKWLIQEQAQTIQRH